MQPRQQVARAVRPSSAGILSVVRVQAADLPFSHSCLGRVAQGPSCTSPCGGVIASTKKGAGDLMTLSPGSSGPPDCRECCSWVPGSSGSSAGDLALLPDMPPLVTGLLSQALLFFVVFCCHKPALSPAVLFFSALKLLLAGVSALAGACLWPAFPYRPRRELPVTVGALCQLSN